MRKRFTGPLMLLVLLATLLVASSVSAAGAGKAKASGGGNVLPASAKPHGYSLTQAAAATAYFNAGARTSDTLPANFPFQILYDDYTSTGRTFKVKPGTMFYVPVVYNTNSEPVLAGYPSNVNDQKAVAEYYFGRSGLGAEYLNITVDGKTTSLDRLYPVGVETPGLSDNGFPASTYTVAAAFLTPLKPGTHTVTISARLTGDALDIFGGDPFEFATEYTVVVK